jgi:hypothetical protein
MVSERIIFLGVTLDFLTILMTGKNIDNTFGFQAIITYMWAPPVALLGIIIGSELLIPKGKTIIIFIFVILGLIYEIVLFLNPFGSLSSIPPDNLGQSLIHTNIIFGTPLFLIMGLYFISLFVLLDFGTLYKGFKTKGIIRKKYFTLSLGFFMYHIIAIFDAYSYPGVYLIFIRSGIFVCFLLWYLGLKEELIIPKKKHPKKEVKVEGSLFLLSEIKPGEITEEEVTFFREQKICLVCKGKELGFTYICPNCEAFYCMKCAQALSNQENACWVCDEPFDKSKPSKPYKPVDEDKEVLISEKDQKLSDEKKVSKKKP